MSCNCAGARQIRTRPGMRAFDWIPMVGLLSAGIVWLTIGAGQAARASIVIDNFSAVNAPTPYTSGNNPSYYSTASTPYNSNPIVSTSSPASSITYTPQYCPVCGVLVPIGPNAAGVTTSPTSWSVNYAPGTTPVVTSQTVQSTVVETGLTLGSGANLLPNSTRTSQMNAVNVSSAASGAKNSLTTGQAGPMGFSIGSGVLGQLTLSYNLGSTLSNVKDVNVIIYDLDDPMKMTLSGYGGAALTITGGPTNDTDETETFDLSGLFSFSSFSLQFSDSASGPSCLDFKLDGITYNSGSGSAGSGSPAPEPPSPAIWALAAGIGGLGLVRVCRKRREAATA